MLAGKPVPTVIWYRDELPITTETFVAPERRSVRNEITVGPLGRQDLNTRLSCKAINHPRATPLESTVQVDMNCKYNLYRNAGTVLSFRIIYPALILPFKYCVSAYILLYVSDLRCYEDG